MWKLIAPAAEPAYPVDNPTQWQKVTVITDDVQTKSRMICFNWLWEAWLPNQNPNWRQWIPNVSIHVQRVFDNFYCFTNFLLNVVMRFGYECNALFLTGVLRLWTLRIYQIAGTSEVLSNKLNLNLQEKCVKIKVSSFPDT